MEKPQLEIRDQQKAAWSKFSSGWKKWDAINMVFLKPMGDEIIRKLHLSDDALVLDIAAGTGEPGLTIASGLMNGKVVITDLSDDMLVVARENAAARGIRNIETKACDVCELPFDDNTFDAVSCRFGFMFFPDMQLAANELFRVLKPGGRIATAVWSTPDKNSWITVMANTVNRTLNIPPLPPGAPGIFRCAQSGSVGALFQQAGFRNVSENEVGSALKIGTAENYWNMITELAAPVVAALSKTDEHTRMKIKEEVTQILHSKFPDGNVALEAASFIVHGVK